MIAGGDICGFGIDHITAQTKDHAVVGTLKFNKFPSLVNIVTVGMLTEDLTADGTEVN
jgi:hypothetical protein